MTATCFMLLSLFTFWNFLEKPNLRNILLAGLVIGLAQLSKYSLLILYPIYFIFVLWKTREKNSSKILLKYISVCLLSVFIIWLGYGFEFSPLLKDAMRQKEKLDLIQNYLLKTLPNLNFEIISNFLLNVPMALSSYILGILGVFRHSEMGHSTYFLGTQLNYGNKLYFLLAYLLKTPLPSIVFFLTSLVLIFKKKVTKKEMYLLTVILVVFVGASFSKLQLGLRYILPIYPILFILSSSTLEFWLISKKRIIFSFLTGWYIISVILTWPNYLSYFNEITGGPSNGWKYLRDSNLDWGQDLPALSRYLNERKIENITLNYFGQDKPENYGINFNIFSPKELVSAENKVYAISVNYLDNIKWTKIYKPDFKAGNSIFIYDLRTNQAAK